MLVCRFATIAAATLFALLLGSGSAWATSCSVPNFFVNSTIADADTVNANFTAVLACVNVNSVVGPNSTTNGNAACWNNTTGSLLKDCPAPGSGQGTPANPTGTASASLVMMGLGSSCTIIPNRSGKVLLVVSGNAANSASGDGWAYQIRYGIGGAPANAMAVTGTAATTSAPDVPPTGIALPFSTQGVVTGLALGTPVWFDVALQRFGAGGGTASVTNLTCSSLESRLDFRHSPRWRSDPANDNGQLRDLPYAA